MAICTSPTLNLVVMAALYQIEPLGVEVGEGDVEPAQGACSTASIMAGGPQTKWPWRPPRGSQRSSSASVR